MTNIFALRMLAKMQANRQYRQKAGTWAGWSRPDTHSYHHPEHFKLGRLARIEIIQVQMAKLNDRNIIRVMKVNHPDAWNELGLPPLLLRTFQWWASLRVIQILLKRGAMVDTNFGKRGTALQIASQWGRISWQIACLSQSHKAIVDLLRKHGAAMDADEPESLVRLWNGDHGVPEMWEHA
ncbi:hypothetical protein B0H13DRAFT_1851103 [Mycena leptocephala]|nr:hypothetical protein B0H13DRAFT_1851103 [Mycena leptocephala]